MFNLPYGYSNGKDIITDKEDVYTEKDLDRKKGLDLFKNP